MNTKMLTVTALNLIFIAVLLTWPLINSPKFSISIEGDPVPLGGKLNFTLSFPSVPSEVRIEVLYPESNRTIYSASLNPGSEVKGSVEIEEGKFRIGFHVLKVHAILNGQRITEESYFRVYGASPIYLELSAEKPTLVLKMDPTEANYTQARERILAKVRTEGGPVEGVKLLAISIGPNSTVTEVARTNSKGEAVLEWHANVTGNFTYRVVVQAVKPGHPLASGEVSIEVIVRRGD